MRVSLQPITKNNYEECFELKVRTDQTYVEDNTYSIAESKIYPEALINAIYADNTMVGFTMYYFDYPKEYLWVWRLMIDQKYQGKGYGKATLKILKEIAQNASGIKKLSLSANKENTETINFYEKCGFVNKGTYIKDNGEESEVVFEIILNK